MTRTILVSMLLAVGACYATPQPECAFACEPGAGSCAEGYSCRPDGLCKLDSVPDDFACPDIGDGVDAAVIDGTPPIDATVIDAAVIDGAMEDAPTDARPIDAAVIDAAVIDAPVIDAPDIDAPTPIDAPDVDAPDPIDAAIDA